MTTSHAHLNRITSPFKGLYDADDTNTSNDVLNRLDEPQTTNILVDERQPASKYGDMPTIGSDWDSGWVDQMWPDKKTFVPRPSISKPVNEELIKANYKIDELTRELSFSKDLAKVATDKLSLYMRDYDQLALDFRNSEYAHKRVEKEISSLEHVRKLNLYLMQELVNVGGIK